MPVPKELVVAGRTVQVASPDEVNELDLAAKTRSRRPAMPPTDTASLAPAKTCRRGNVEVGPL